MHYIYLHSYWNNTDWVWCIIDGEGRFQNIGFTGTAIPDGQLQKQLDAAHQFANNKFGNLDQYKITLG
ncbi:MAG: hypothetical protein K0U45_01645 [Alphaproteobacteria bacterium]|nr:hypothetical protein [Alphaproteobacteria bacterium]